MPLPLQTRLLRVLAEGEFFRVGGRELIRVDVRVIAATHQPLEALVEQGRFRADLLHRLDVVRLRCRRCANAARTSRCWPHASWPAAQRCVPTKPFSAAALELLRAHDWPGNVRELENVCWRLAALAPGECASSCRPAWKTCMHRRRLPSTAPCCRPRWIIAMVTAARRLPYSAWVATPSPANSVRRASVAEAACLHRE
jgi:DNA-binding NtrC family response regulator